MIAVERVGCRPYYVHRRACDCSCLRCWSGLLGGLSIPAGNHSVKGHRESFEVLILLPDAKTGAIFVRRACLLDSKHDIQKNSIMVHVVSPARIRLPGAVTARLPHQEEHPRRLPRAVGSASCAQHSCGRGRTGTRTRSCPACAGSCPHS